MASRGELVSADHCALWWGGRCPGLRSTPPALSVSCGWFPSPTQRQQHLRGLPSAPQCDAPKASTTETASSPGKRAGEGRRVQAAATRRRRRPQRCYSCLRPVRGSPSGGLLISTVQRTVYSRLYDLDLLCYYMYATYPVSRQPSIWSIDPTFRHCY